MAKKTKIEWTESSWNPITGCSKISDGCLNCYAFRMAKRLKAMGNIRYIKGFEVNIHKDIIDLPLRWKSPRKIFVNSMSDLFHEDVSDDIILQIFETMNKAHWHIFQVLTKRSHRIIQLNKRINWTENIWLGVTVESDKYINRINDLKATEAKTKFISAEPLLSNLLLDLNGIDWVIVGGESGPGARPIKEEWIWNIKQQCEESNTAFFFKQWGGTQKKKNGSLLRGLEYKAYPNL